MKRFDDFVVEQMAAPEAAKLLKKKFRGVKDSSKKLNPKRMRGSRVGSLNIPNEKPSVVRDYLKSVGWKVADEMEGFIDMYKSDFRAGVTFKATIVSNDTSRDLEIRLSSNSSVKSSKSFRKDTFSNQNAINQNKFSGKSPRYR